MKKGNKGVKIMAILALFGIIIGIVGTGLLIIFGGGQSYQSEQTLSPEEYLELQELIKANSGTGIETATGVNDLEIITGTGIEVDVETASGEVK